MSLKDYNSKRDFSKTSEPIGELSSEDGGLRFVVQRHEARQLHFDLRLEMEGVLKSWAIPKGPSLNANDKRLAVETEDHPLSYLQFHGTIPSGNYGAGTMTIWDTGTYELDTQNDTSPSSVYESGDIKITFFGSKLRGKFALVKTSLDGKQPQWLLIKKKDEFATDLDYDADLHLDAITTQPEKIPKSVSPLSQVSPMLASSGNTLDIPSSKKWLYEIKWDGYRMICNHSQKGTFLYSRNGVNYNSAFPDLVKNLSNLPHTAIIDGEVVSLDKDGISRFQWLQNYADTQKGNLTYVVFDLLYLNGHSILHLKLEERKELLQKMIQGIPRIKFSEHVIGNGKIFYEEVRKKGLEGIIGKKANSMYFPGLRSEAWIKYKSQESLDCIICGYTTSQNRPFGSLILGAYIQGILTYIGNCGTGFSLDTQNKLVSQFIKISSSKSPFVQKPNIGNREANWVKPVMIAEVTFAEWTSQNKLRQPVFKTIRKSSHQEPKSIESQPDTKIKSKTPDNALELNGYPVVLSNLEKLLWPEDGISKYHLIDYYLKIAPYILPFLKDRPQSLHRHPNGINQKSFYQKDTPNGYPDWIQTKSIYSESTEKNIEYMLCQNEATLIYMANLGCIEVNPWNSRIETLDKPDYIVIDLDPSDKNDFKEVVEVAQAFYELFNELKIESFCKTSGASGLHIYIPLGAQYTFEEGRNFCKLLCTIIQEKLPKLTTMERSLNARKERIYLDYLQNRPGQTLASVYSVRPQPGAPVSTPLSWDEVNSKLDKNDFTIFTIEKKITNSQNFFHKILGKGIKIESILENLDL